MYCTSNLSTVNYLSNSALQGLFENLILNQLAKKFLNFMESRSSSRESHDPAAGSCSEPVESRPHFISLTSHPQVGPSFDLLPSGFSRKFCMDLFLLQNYYVSFPSHPL